MDESNASPISRDDERPKSIGTIIAPLVLASDALIAVVLWIFRENIFGTSNSTDMIAMIVCGGLIVSGLAVYFVFKAALKEIQK